jgi:ankyrin repeat protein
MIPTQDEGRTPLMVAAAQGHLQAIEALVRSGVSVNATGMGRMTALHEAAANGHGAAVKMLLLAGADIDSLTVDNATPLMCAAAWGYLDVAKLLLENGADSKRVDRYGDTAAEIAREKGENSVADFLDAR